MTVIDTRRDQMFPVLSASQIETARRFASGEAQRFGPGRTCFRRGPASGARLAGSRRWDRGDPSRRTWAARADRDGGRGAIQRGSEPTCGAPLLGHRPGGIRGATAVPFDAAHVRALVIGSADIGEIVMRALIVRRAAMIETKGSGSVLLGRPGSAEIVRLEGFLSRNGYPTTVLDAAVSGEGRELVERFGVCDDELPLMLCPNGTVLKRPTDAQAAMCLGITPELDPEKVYDVAVVGAGPAGLATAVYAASEGLSVLVLDQRAIGGQAGASARIQNYLGFPTGISGQALAGRAFNQAKKFGAEIALPLEVARLAYDASAAPGDRALSLELTTGVAIRSRVVVVASGARYR